MRSVSTRSAVGDHNPPTVMSMGQGDAGRMLALLRGASPAVSRRDIVDAVLDHGSIDAAAQSFAVPSLFDAEAERLDAAVADVASWRARGIGVHAFTDPDYPSALRAVVEAPPILFTRGRCRPDELAVAVVGARRASGRGRGWAAELAAELSRREVTVVSGGALGIDAAAHGAALASDGRTVAVLGTGVGRCYPPEHEDLQAEIADRGMLVSELPPDEGPTKQSFPQRNALMSGYCAATVVVEAEERSGTRVQARVAVQQGRRVLLSRGVAEGTAWGAALAERAAVQVVDAVDDAVDRLWKILLSQADSHDELKDDLIV